MADKKNLDSKVLSDIYDYIKYVDEKVGLKDETIKFISSLQSEQMKELVLYKTENLKKFFEEAIMMQTEVVRNAYDDIIEDLKNKYEQEIHNNELNSIRFLNEKEEALKILYEDKITLAIEKTKLEYEKIIEEIEARHRADFDKTVNDYEKRISEMNIWNDNTVKEYEKRIAEMNSWNENTVKEYEERISEINSWHEKNLQEKLSEQQSFYENEMEIKSREAYENGKNELDQKCSEAYENGKKEVEAWHDDIVRQKLEVQATYFDEEILKARQLGREEMKKEMYQEMDEAAKRNEEELKLFIDYYENKIRPFKKIINFHDSADRKVKDIERRIKNKINKMRGRRDLIIPPDRTYEKYVAKTKEFQQQDNQQENQ